MDSKTMMTGVPSPTLGPREGARIAGISEPTFCRLCRKGVIPAVKIGNQWRISRSWLLTWLGLE